MKFRKKPVVIEAITFDEFVQYGKDNGGNIVNGFPWHFKYQGHGVTHENDQLYLIPTSEGVMHFTPEDMLITGVKGEIYPCKIDIFEATYNSAETTRLSFGQAIEAMKEGYKVSRIGWNGKGMFLVFVGSDSWGSSTDVFGKESQGSYESLPWIGMKTADNKFVPWLASQTDVLAMDWGVVE